MPLGVHDFYIAFECPEALPCGAVAGPVTITIAPLPGAPVITLEQLTARRRKG
jgi:hypothetical protein